MDEVQKTKECETKECEILNKRYNEGVCIEQVDSIFICNRRREKDEDLCKKHIQKQFNIFDDTKDVSFDFEFSINNVMK